MRHFAERARRATLLKWALALYADARRLALFAPTIEPPLQSALTALGAMTLYFRQVTNTPASSAGAMNRRDAYLVPLLPVSIIDTGERRC